MGIAHGFEKEAIRDACLQGYPRLASDLQLAPENRGLVTFISDHIVDFEILTGATPPERNRVEEADIEKDALKSSQMSVPYADGNRSQNAPVFDPYADINDKIWPEVRPNFRSELGQ